MDKNPSAGCPNEGQRKEKETYFTSINLSNRRSAIRKWKRPPLHSSSSIGAQIQSIALVAAPPHSTKEEERKDQWIRGRC